jgi:putative transposase
MDIKVGAHCRYQIRYHLVWGVKFRRKILLANRTAYLKRILQEICEANDWQLEAVGTDEDHVHVFVGAHPKTAPASMVQVLKSKTARELFIKFPEIKKYLWGGAVWSVGYYIRTVSDGPLEGVIKAYVEKQGEHRAADRGKPYQLKLVP